MIYKKIETTTEEVMEFIKAAGIEVKDDPTAKSFRIELADGAIIETPSNFNIFEETSSFTSVESCSYSLSGNNNDNDSNISNNSNNSKTYISGNLKNEFNNSANSFKSVSAA